MVKVKSSSPRVISYTDTKQIIISKSSVVVRVSSLSSNNCVSGHSPSFHFILLISWSPGPWPTSLQIRDLVMRLLRSRVTGSHPIKLFIEIHILEFIKSVRAETLRWIGIIMKDESWCLLQSNLNISPSPAHGSSQSSRSALELGPARFVSIIV